MPSEADIAEFEKAIDMFKNMSPEQMAEMEQGLADIQSGKVANPIEELEKRKADHEKKTKGETEVHDEL